ncbi:HAD family acid phosphatase [Streptomyces sp. NPDC049910]|uniref:HAD family acid phosphatase n=1 Tax=Streptomyces sp. NPDC049910 TaxID=3155278 RepID=UPI0034495370
MHVRRWTTRAAVTAGALTLTATMTATASADTASTAPRTSPAAASATAAPPAAPATSASPTTSAASSATSPSSHAASTAGTAHTPRTADLTAAGLAGVDYTTWQRDVTAALATARPYVEQRTAGAAGERLAMVLDIDNTSLETDFHYFWEYPTPAVGQVLDLVRYADSRGVDIFFVTARPGIIETLTSYNLRKAGFPVDGLYVRSLPDLFDEVSTYKTGKRKEIEAKGYTIIANVGNRSSDLAGGHAERTFKLPDYGGKLS